MVKNRGQIHTQISLALSITLLSVLLLLLTAYCIKANYTTFSQWTQEDGIIESATSILFLFSSIFFLIVYHKSQFLNQRTEWWRYGLVLAWAMLMLTFSGEEISWGQRLLNLHTHDKNFFQANAQHEINLHNLQALQDIKPMLLNSLMISAGLILPAAVLLPIVRKFVQFIAMPSVPLPYSALFLLAFLLNSNLLYPRKVYGNPPREVAELVFALAMFCVALHGALRPDSLFRVVPSDSGRDSP